MSQHVTLTDDGTITLAEGSTLADLQLPPVPTLVETILEEQKAPAAPELTQEQVEAIEAEAAELKERQKAITTRLDELKGFIRTIPADSTLKVSAGRATPKVIQDDIVEAKYPYDAIDTEDVVVTGPRGGKKIETRLVFPNRHLYKITVDKTAVKKHLGADELAEVQVDGTTRVTF